MWLLLPGIINTSNNNVFHNFIKYSPRPSTIKHLPPPFPLFFFFFCSSHSLSSHIFFSLSFQLVTQIRGHIAGSSPPFPLRYTSTYWWLERSFTYNQHVRTRWSGFKILSSSVHLICGSTHGQKIICTIIRIQQYYHTSTCMWQLLLCIHSCCRPFTRADCTTLHCACGRCCAPHHIDWWWSRFRWYRNRREEVLLWRRQNRCIHKYMDLRNVNPFRTAVPFWGQTTWNFSELSSEWGLQS